LLQVSGLISKRERKRKTGLPMKRRRMEGGGHTVQEVLILPLNLFLKCFLFGEILNYFLYVFDQLILKVKKLYYFNIF
jgi:hypothetical protein